MLCPSNLVASITAAAIALSKDRSVDEIELLAVVFAQLGDTLATIAQQKGIIEAKFNKQDDDKKEAT